MSSKKPNYFKMHRFALRIFGLSLNETESNFYEKSTFLLLLIVCAYPFLASVDLFREDFEGIAGLLKYEFTVLLGVVKIRIVRINRKEIGKLLEKLENKPFIENFERGGDEEKQLIKQCNFITTIQTYVYWAITVTIYSVDVLYTLSKRIRSNDYHNWSFPFGAFTLFNATVSPNYELSWLYQSFCCGCIGFLFVIVDATMAAILVHITFQLKILQVNLRRLVKNSFERMLKETYKEAGTSFSSNLDVNQQLSVAPWKYLKKSLKEAVEYHLAIINIANIMNTTFSSLLLIIYLGTLGILSFMVYIASTVTTINTRLIGNLGEIVIIAGQVFLTCYWAEEVMFESEEVATAAFQSDFVGTDLRFQKGLILIIRRSQTPIIITAGKFINIGLAALTRIMRSTYSAFMLLRNQNLNKVTN